MKVNLIHATPLKIVVKAVRMCHGSTSTNPLEDERLLRKMVDLGHESTIEHATYTYEIYHISRVLLAQLTRHRIASYSVRSHRYTTIDGMIIPYTVRDHLRPETVEEFEHSTTMLYNALIESGVPKEDARYMMPQASTTDLILTMNARSLRNFFKLRLSKEAQWEIRTLAENMFLKLPKEHRDTIFYDIKL